MSIDIAIPYSLMEKEIEKISALSDYPRVILPIERFGQKETLEVIWTYRLLPDDELSTESYKSRAWKPEDGTTTFPYAMARRPREGIDYSVILYCSEALFRARLNIPAFKIFDFDFTPPQIPPSSSVTSNEKFDGKDTWVGRYKRPSASIRAYSIYPSANSDERRMEHLASEICSSLSGGKELQPSIPESFADQEPYKASRHIKPLPKRYAQLNTRTTVGEYLVQNAHTGPIPYRPSVASRSKRKLEKEDDSINRSWRRQSTEAATPCVSIIVSSVLSALGFGCARRTRECSNHNDREEEGPCRKRARPSL